MGNWVIHIEGTGTHHNKALYDADVIAEQTVQALQQAGQTVEHATFTSGSRHSAMPPQDPPSSL